MILEETGLLVLQRLREVSDTTHSGELRASLERLGIREPRGGRERAGTSSFRSLESVAAVATEPAPSWQVSASREGGPQKRLTWTLLCVVVVVTLMVLDRMFPHIRTPVLDTASESFEPPSSVIELATDMPGRRDPGGRLGALFYAISEGARQEAPPSNPVTANSPAPQPAHVEAKAEPLPARSKEEVDTTGPIEGAEFRDRAERIRPRVVQPRRQVLQGGTPRAVLPGASPREFEDQRTYRVLTRTSVLSAPSYGGRVIGQLEAGDRVLVEGKLGRWLRLRPKTGRGGYVLTADVEQVSEPDSVSIP